MASREDDSVDDPGYMEGSGSDKAEYVHRDHQQEQWGAGSPPSRKSSRRTSLREAFRDVTEEDERPIHHETHPLSSEEDITDSIPANVEEDTFDRVLTQYDKDEQRVRGALGSDVQPFKKSRTRDKAGLTVENLNRENASSKSGSSTRGSPSISSRGSDPSFNIPQGWGRKGRGNNTWLSRISQESGKFTGDRSNIRALQPAKASAEGGKESSSQIVDWIAAAAEVPLPSVENDSLQTDSTSRRSTPVSHLKRQTSSDRIRRWEFLDDDFTARSLQVSDSPPIRIKNGVLDAIREREIENLEKSAVTTSRLGELKEQKSLERVRRRSPSLATEVVVEDKPAEAERDSGRRASSGSSLHPAHDVEEADTRQNQPSIQHKSPEPSIERADTVTARPSTLIKDTKQDWDASTVEHSQRPSTERHDSRDLLRKLARATSASPGPSPPGPELKHVKATAGTTDDLKSSAAEARQAQVDGSSGENGRNTESGPDSERRPLLSSRALVESTPPPQTRPNVYLKTPLVTGAWIDTPLPTGSRGPPMPTPEITADDEEPSFDNEAVIVKLDSDGVVTASDVVFRPERPPRPSLAETAPLLPKSALAAIIEKAKSNAKRQDQESTEANDDTLLLDDSTIQSLEELLTSDNTNPALLTPPRSSSPSSPPGSHRKSPQPHTTEVTTREQEVQSYNSLTSRLSKVRLSISDAKKGIASLERAVSTAPSNPSSALASTEECPEAGEFHDFIWPCERCGCPGRDQTIEWQSLGISMPKLWTWRKEDWLPRLTRLGTITTMLWVLATANWIVE